MVRIRDDGVFDAPIDKLWKYFNDNAAHNHTSFQITKVLEQKGNAMTIMAKTRNPSGGLDTEKFLMTVNQPKGFSLEYLSGAMKGSKHTHTYTAKGNKTRVEVDGVLALGRFLGPLDDAMPGGGALPIDDQARPVEIRRGPFEAASLASTQPGKCAYVEQRREPFVGGRVEKSTEMLGLPGPHLLPRCTRQLGQGRDVARDLAGLHRRCQCGP